MQRKGAGLSITRVGVVGGTGPAGKGLAFRLASAEVQVVVGSRDPQRALAVCQKVDSGRSWKRFMNGGTNEDAAECDLVVLATPWDALVPTIKPLKDILAGKIVVTIANALVKTDQEFQPVLLAEGSVAALVSSLLPASSIVSAFQHVPAGELLDIDHDLKLDVLMCGDDVPSKLLTAEIFGRIDGVRLLDGGSLAMSGAIEAMTAVLLNLNLKYKTRTSIRISGIEA